MLKLSIFCFEKVKKKCYKHEQPHGDILRIWCGYLSGHYTIGYLFQPKMPVLRFYF